MLTNPVQRVWRPVNAIKHGTPYILYVWYGFLLVCYSKSVRRTVFDIFDFKNAVTLKTGLSVLSGYIHDGCPSRSLEMSPYDRARMTSY